MRQSAGNPNVSEAWANRADALVHLGRYQEAVDSASRALTIDPTIEGAKTTRLVATKMLENGAYLHANTHEKSPGIPGTGNWCTYCGRILVYLRKWQK